MRSSRLRAPQAIGRRDGRENPPPPYRSAAFKNRHAGGDPADDGLVAFYATYRALVRAKVAFAWAERLPASSADHERAKSSGERLLSVARRFAWRSRAPLLLVMCGVAASGKSALAKRVCDVAGFPHLSSDITRKRLAGLDPNERGVRSSMRDLPQAGSRTQRIAGVRAGRRSDGGPASREDAQPRPSSARSGCAEPRGRPLRRLPWRAIDVRVGTKDATVAFTRPQDQPAPRALVEPLASSLGHLLAGCRSAPRTRDRRFELHTPADQNLTPGKVFSLTRRAPASPDWHA